MPTPPLSMEDAQEVADAYHAALADGFSEVGKPSARVEAAKRLNMDVSKYGRRFVTAQSYGLIHRGSGSRPKNPPRDARPSPIEYPVFPDDDVSVEQIIEYQERRFTKRQESHAAHTWFKVKVNDHKPIGVLFIGDPHLDDAGTNWPMLKKHVDLCKTTDGLYGANIGDTTNNWAGRLVHLYAQQETSLKTAQKLAAWFMLDSGIKWLIWLLGNHDKFGDGAGVLAQMAKRYGTKEIICHDWEARFSLVFPGGQEFRIWAAHDFPGNSQWNPLHGPMKAAKLGQEAHLFVCGHKHNWGIYTYENADRGITQTMIRVRGYKFLDEHARKFTLAEQQGGCSILTIFDPKSPAPLAFQDVEQGVDYLKWLRRK